MKLLFFILFSIILCIQSYCQTPADTFRIKSKYVEHGNYIAEITLPPNYQSDKAYPIFYFLDLKLAEPLMKEVSDSLLKYKQVSEYIFVGIKCDDTARWCGPQRFRDFSPSYNKEFESEINKDTTSHITGGAPQFLKFLKHELIPLVEGKYKSIPEKRTLFGMSFSGLFASYVMLNDPMLFSQYMIGSPSFWYNNFEVIEQFKSTNAKKLKSITNVYVCVGGKEYPSMISGYNDFRKLLLEKEVNVTAEIYPDKDHLGIWKDCLIKGIKNSFPLQN